LDKLPSTAETGKPPKGGFLFVTFVEWTRKHCHGGRRRRIAPRHPVGYGWEAKVRRVTPACESEPRTATRIGLPMSIGVPPSLSGAYSITYVVTAAAPTLGI